VFVTSRTIERLAPLSARAGLTSGTYALKAVVFEQANGVSSSRILETGTATLEIDAATKTYTLTVDVAGYPDGERFDLQYPSGADATGFGYRVRMTEQYSDGSAQVSVYDFDRGQCCSPHWIETADGGVVETVYSLDVHPQYVSLGSWSRRIGNPVPGTTGYTFDGPQQYLGFVQGIRTEAGDLPVSGTATYHADLFTLLADFGAGSIAANIDIEPFYDPYPDGPCYACRIGMSATGQASIKENGDFLIPLSGQFFEPDGDPSGALTGLIDGAFFGPQGAEVGGVYQLYHDGAAWSADAFVGTQGP